MKTNFLLSVIALSLSFSSHAAFAENNTFEVEDSFPEIVKAPAQAGIPPRDARHLHSNTTFEKAMQLTYSSDDELAIALFSKYIEQFQAKSKSIKNEDKKEHDYYLAEGYRHRCSLYLNHGQIDKGITDCNELIKIKPSVDVYLLRAKAYRAIGKIQLAKQDEQLAGMMMETSAKNAKPVQRTVVKNKGKSL